MKRFCMSFRASRALALGMSFSAFAAGVSVAAYAAVEVRAGQLSFTGTGAALRSAPAGAATNVTASEIVFIGTRAPLTAPASTSGPVEVRTPGISFNGTNSM